MLLHTLPNGLQVLLLEKRTAPVLSFSALVRVGSADENDSEAGLSHVIEHMLFKGTPSRSVGAIASEVEGAGGDINAYTSFDQTVYYINMASRFSDKGLEILADAIQNPLFDSTELERENNKRIELLGCKVFEIFLHRKLLDARLPSSISRHTHYKSLAPKPSGQGRW